MKYKLIGCSAVYRELCALAALSPHTIDLVLLPPGQMRSRELQQAVSAAADADYILLGCGLCAAEGLTAGKIPVVVPAVHNCAHLLMGDAQRYREAFSENDDQPRWLSPAGCEETAPRCGTPCAVVSPFGPRPALPDGVREYAADLSLLRDLVNGNWDERFVVLTKGLCLRASHTRTIAEAEPSDC